MIDNTEKKQEQQAAEPSVVEGVVIARLDNGKLVFLQAKDLPLCADNHDLFKLVSEAKDELLVQALTKTVLTKLASSFADRG